MALSKTAAAVPIAPNACGSKATKDMKPKRKFSFNGMPEPTPIDKIAPLHKLLVKRATPEDRGSARLALVGGGLAAAGVGAFLGHQMDKTLNDTPNTKHQGYINSIRSKSDVPGALPILKAPGFGNAAYFDPHDYKAEEWGRDVDPKMTERVKQHGLVAYDPEFNKPGIIGHELGHASIRLAPWYSPSRINQGPLRTIGDIANRWVAPVAGVAAGISSRNPWIGAGVGLGAGALTGLPTLINEYQASHRGAKFMDRTGGLEPEVAAKNKSALRKAWMTYLAAATVPALAAGGLAAVIRNNVGK